MVGRLTDHVESDDAAAYVSGATDAALTSDAQAVLVRAWYAAPEEMAYFDALNEASTTAFLNHAATLGVRQDSSEGLKRSRGRHLPHWIESYWLPVRSDRSTDGPVFFGSAYGLSCQSCRYRRRFTPRPGHHTWAFRAHASQPEGVLRP